MGSSWSTNGDEPRVVPYRGLLMGIKRAWIDFLERLSAYAKQVPPRSEMGVSPVKWKILGR
jgi:hypothetical protein